MDAALAELVPLTSKTAACRILGKSRATLHRQENPRPADAGKPAAASHALTSHIRSSSPLAGSGHGTSAESSDRAAARSRRTSPP
jgi:hypothetical protein